MASSHKCLIYVQRVALHELSSGGYLKIRMLVHSSVRLILTEYICDARAARRCSSIVYVPLNQPSVPRVKDRYWLHQWTASSMDHPDISCILYRRRHKRSRAENFSRNIGGNATLWRVSGTRSTMDGLKKSPIACYEVERRRGPFLRNWWPWRDPWILGLITAFFDTG